MWCLWDWIQKRTNSEKASFYHTKRERNYMCEECDKKFIDLTNLQQHMKLHYAETLYPCPQCEKLFGQPNYLKNHFETAHATMKPFQCQICKKEFAMFRMLNKHMKSHLRKPMNKKEKKFKCESCIKTFSLKINLIKHRFIHKWRLQFCLYNAVLRISKSSFNE